MFIHYSTRIRLQVCIKIWSTYFKKKVFHAGEAVV